MTSPRHLHDLTAEMPAIRSEPRHAAPTEAIPRIDYNRSEFYPPRPGPTEPPRIESVGWWQRFLRWLKGTEEWKR